MRRQPVPAPELPPRKARRIVTALLEWFAAHARDLPWRSTRDPYAVWVSEIMLQQTQVKTVIPYFERWMRALPDLRALAGAPAATIHKLWEGLGYYTRVRNLQRAAQVVMARHDGVFPEQFDEVLALPGIGRYTAGAICSIAFHQPAPILDGNVIRVLTRIFDIAGNARERKTTDVLWHLSTTLVETAAQSRDRAACSALNQSLMELGATVCTPRAPQCDQCPLRNVCAARHGGRAESRPNLGKRVPATARWFVAVAVSRAGKWLVRQRPEGVVNAHLWEFPNVEVPPGATVAEMRAALEQDLGAPLASMEPLCVVRHSITRFRITLEAFRGEIADGRPRASAGVWKSPVQTGQLAFTSAHRRVAGMVVPPQHSSRPAS
jgi:A/G-specific adenine glycosylase